MIPTIQSVLFILLSLTGLIVCRQSLYRNSFYRYGYWFFLLFLLATMYGLINIFFTQRIIERLMEAGASPLEIGRTLTFGYLPGALLELLGFLILVVGFYKLYKECGLNSMSVKGTFYCQNNNNLRGED